MRGLENYNIENFEAVNSYGFPIVPPCKIGVDLSAVKWIDFDTAITKTKRDKTIPQKYNGLHFYIDDYKFLRIWNCPQRYIEFLKKFEYVIMPDFSMYYNFPKALQIYNKYRNHWLAAYYYTHGVNIVPDVSLSTPDCFEWSVLGYPNNSLVAFSDIGTKRDKTEKEVILQAYEFMKKEIKPSHVIYFTRSKFTDVKDNDITVVHLPFFRTTGGD